MRVLLLLALVGFAAAECPDACSGHGFCGQYDKCTCYRNWMGNSCEKRTCPYDLAFVDVPLGDLNMDGDRDRTHVTYGAQTNDRVGMEVWPTDDTLQSYSGFYDQDDDGHFYAECSNKGMCDRKSGLCSCFDGYSGTACRRVACPNDCSGHGTCERMEEFGQAYWVNQDNTGNGVSGTTYKYELWDRYKSQVCHCDPGYFGIDCSNRYCPRGDDPLTTNQYDEVQTIDIECGTAACAGEFRLQYVDTYGETWDTMPLPLTGYSFSSASANTAFANAVRTALKGIPNSVFEDVTVDFEPHHTIIPGVATITSTTVTTWATGVVNDLVTAAAINSFCATDGSDGLTGCGTAASAAGQKEIQAVASATGGAITTAAFTNSPAAGTICKTKVYGGRLSITFTSNPGDLNNVDSTHAMVHSRGDTLASSGMLTHGGTGKTVSVDTDLSSYLQEGDRVYASGMTNTPVFTLASDPTAPVAGTLGSFTIEETYGTAQSAKAFSFYNKGTKELEECSHRGLCDHSAGVCECFNGYTNDDCSMQQALAA